MMRATTRWPVATVSVLAVTAVLTVPQFPFPQVRTALWRDRRRQVGDRSAATAGSVPWS